MEPKDDPQLSRLLKEWKVPDAPATLENRILERPVRWWRRSIQIPVPVGMCAAIALIVLAILVIRDRPATGTLDQPVAEFSLKDFRPVKNTNVRIIRSVYENQ
jgi:hypothetical protein